MCFHVLYDEAKEPNLACHQSSLDGTLHVYNYGAVKLSVSLQERKGKVVRS